jgi:exonuclease SbcD
MAMKPLRLLHAANLRLDCPLQQFGTWSDEIRDLMESATLLAFDRLVSLAIERDVDALLITGNTFDSFVASLAAEVALRSGFERLNERDIPVFVTPGPLDPIAAWNDLPSLPENVTILANPDEPPIDLTDRGRVIATIVPVTADSTVDPHELDNILASRSGQGTERSFVIGMALPMNEPLPANAAARYSALDWLACASGDNFAAHLPLTDGTENPQDGPQGLSINEAGPRGATLLEVDSQRRVKQSLIPLSPIRWEQITQSLDRVSSRDDLLERMLSAVERLSTPPGELMRIIHWKLDRTTGETRGWEMESAIQELAAALTELTDQSNGLRYIHQIQPLEPDLSLIEPAHRELLTEYLLALDRRSPVEHAAMEKWLSDARLNEVLKTNRWEMWADSVDPETVAERAQQLGWQWFATIGKR